ncbi:uncharacterized protein LOC141910025 [Tubulanus polymorphus]|uniref:uncharacterized protein LOC141910025 n=1 Tax=Tubulanus polymorphus TaxID=672921 RepID=UPI003DA44336
MMVDSVPVDVDAILSRTRPLSTVRKRTYYKAPEIIDRSGLPVSTDKIEDDDVTLRVKCDGIPRPVVTWYKDNIDVATFEDERFFAEGEGHNYRLTIKCLERADEGTYKFSALNKEGNATALGYIEVRANKKKKSRLAPPSNLSFLAIKEQATVEAKEEEELESIAPSPLSVRLRSARGSLRKDHTWPRCVSALPTECIEFVAEITNEEYMDDAELSSDGAEDVFPLRQISTLSDDSGVVLSFTPRSEEIPETPESYGHFSSRPEFPDYDLPVETHEFSGGGGGGGGDPHELVAGRYGHFCSFDKPGFNEGHSNDPGLPGTYSHSSKPDDNDVITSTGDVTNSNTIRNAIYEVFFGTDEISVAGFHALFLPSLTYFGLSQDFGPLLFVVSALFLAVFRYAVLVLAVRGKKQNLDR